MSIFRPITQRCLALVLVLVAGFVISGCGSSGSSGSTATGSTTSEAQSAATGDIPDNQQFLVYNSAKGGYSIKYPEGWARTGSPTDLTFADKGNSVHLSIAAGTAPSVAQAKQALERSASASSGLKVTSAKTETISGAKVVHLTYEMQGPTDPVTGKRLTLMADRYVLAQGGKVATLDELTPVGVDNVDAFRLIVESFKWN
jgi:hypothetical protein